MIPRRRIEIEAVDLLDLFTTPWRTARRHGDVVAFEAALANYLGSPHVRTAGSGRDALQTILCALQLRPGDEIIVPAYTLGELVPFLQRDGYHLIAADVAPDSFNVTPDSIEAVLTSKTRAILVLHTFGAPCDIAGIDELARTRSVPLIEDCAHAMGANIGTRKVGSFGTAAFFSLEVNKPVASFGGGVIATADADLAQRIDGILARRPVSEWPALRKAALKTLEELAVRSPLYALAARLMFNEQRSTLFERHYRRLHDHVRAHALAYGGFQARMGMRRLRVLDERNTRLNARWQTLARELTGTMLRPQRRDRYGTPAFYNFAAVHTGPLAPLRYQAQSLGIDVAIRGEVMDNAAALLGQTHCPHAAALFESVALLPLHDGVGPSHLAAMAGTLRSLCISAP